MSFSSPGIEAKKSLKNLKEDDGGFNAFFRDEYGFVNEGFNEGVLAPANWKSSTEQNVEVHSPGQLVVALDGSGSKSKVKKVILKVGGVIRMISISNGASVAGSSTRFKQNAQVLIPVQAFCINT